MPSYPIQALFSKILKREQESKNFDNTKWIEVKTYKYRILKVARTIGNSDIMKEKVQAVLNEIRVALQQDGGDIELVEVNEDTGIVRVELQGACRGCPYSQLTLTGYVEKVLKERVPGITQVVNINLEALRTS